MNPIWRVTMEMSKSRSENQKLSKKRHEMLRDKTRKEKEKRRLEALERDRQRFIVGQEQNEEDLERDEELEELQESAAEKFQKELCWCIQQTQVGLASIKASSKEAKPQAEEAHKLLRILTSPKAPMAKKRQVMRSTFGDYRSKMQQEERKHKADMSKRMCLEPVSPSKQGNSTFYRMSTLATAVPSSRLLSTSSDHPGEAGSSGHSLGSPCPDSGSSGCGLRSSDDSRLQGEEVDTSMQELEKSTEGMHILNLAQNETQNEIIGNDNASQCDKAKQIADNGENHEGKHSKQDEELEPFQIEMEKRSSLTLNLNSENQPFSFNFDIKERDIDRSDSRGRGSNKNIDGSLSENSTPEKGPSSSRKKSGSRRRNRGKKKQQALMRDKELTVADNQATVIDNRATVADNQATVNDNRATIADNQKLQLEADSKFRFNFPDPVEQSLLP